MADKYKEKYKKQKKISDELRAEIISLKEKVLKKNPAVSSPATKKKRVVKKVVKKRVVKKHT